MQNPIQKFRQSSIVFKKPGILSENFKTLTSSNYSIVQYFFGETSHVSYLPMSTKGYVRFLKFCLDLYSFFVFLLITQDLNKIKKNPKHPLLDIIK